MYHLLFDAHLRMSYFTKDDSEFDKSWDCSLCQIQNKNESIVDLQEKQSLHLPHSSFPDNTQDERSCN